MQRKLIIRLVDGPLPGPTSLVFAPRVISQPAVPRDPYAWLAPPELRAARKRWAATREEHEFLPYSHPADRHKCTICGDKGSAEQHPLPALLNHQFRPKLTARPGERVNPLMCAVCRGRRRGHPLPAGWAEVGWGGGRGNMFLDDPN
jgi:hypothetical protein